MQREFLIIRPLAALLCGVIVGCAGSAGPAGVTGATGTAGAAGATGAMGATGASGAGTASISGIQPETAFLHRTLDVTVSGSGTNWSATTTLDFGAGVTVNSLVVASVTAIVANITVADTAAIGPRDVKVMDAAGTETYKGAFTVSSPLALTIQGTVAKGSYIDVIVQNLDLANPFNAATDSSGAFTNFGVVLPMNMAQALVSVTSTTAELQIGIGVTAAEGPFVLDVQSGASATTLIDYPFTMPAIVARMPAALTAGTAATGTITQAFGSALYSISGVIGSIADFAVTTSTTGSPAPTPIAFVLPASGLFSDALAASAAATTLSTATTPVYLVVVDPSSGAATYQYSVTATFTSAFYVTIPAIPTNVASTSATPLTSLPAAVNEGLLPDDTTNVWFVYNAVAADVGKSIRVQLVGGDGLNGTDFDILGSDAVTELGQGGPWGSSFAPDFTSDPITAAGPVYVNFQPDPFYYDSTVPHFDAVIRLQ